jgi:hypothetical protein
MNCDPGSALGELVNVDPELFALLRSSVDYRVSSLDGSAGIPRGQLGRPTVLTVR